MENMIHWLYHTLCHNDPAKAAAFWTAMTALCSAVATAGALIAAAAAWRTLKAQAEQSKTDLWRSLSTEFDHDLKGHRRLCATAFQLTNSLENRVAQPVLDFFETVGMLIRKKQIDEELAKHTFEYYFVGYFKGAAEGLRKEHKERPAFYADIFGLRKRWHGNAGIVSEADLARFFEEEEVRK